MENDNKKKLKEVANSVARKAFDAITKQTGKKAEEITPYDIHNSPLLNNLQKRWAREYYLDMHPEVRADMEAEEKILMERSIVSANLPWAYSSWVQMISQCTPSDSTTSRNGWMKWWA